MADYRADIERTLADAQLRAASLFFPCTIEGAELLQTTLGQTHARFSS